MSPDALRVAGGQVRCGRCGEVFNALSRLAEQPSGLVSGESSLELETRADSILESSGDQSAAPDDFEVVETPESDQVQHAVLQFQDESEAIPDASLEFTLPPGELDRIFIEPKPKFLTHPTALPATNELTLDTATTDDAALLLSLSRLPVPAPAPAPAPVPEPKLAVAPMPAPTSAATPTAAAAAAPAPTAAAAPAPTATAAPAPAPESRQSGAERRTMSRTEARPDRRVEPRSETAADRRTEPRTEARPDRRAEPRAAPVAVPAPLIEPHPPVDQAHPDDADIKVLEDVHREFLEGLASSGPSGRAAQRLSTWISAAVMLTLLLCAQWVHRNRESLATSPSFGPILRRVYSQIGAELPASASLSSYQLRQWGVTGEPAASGTLRLRASILNSAGQFQPYPLLRVALLDRFGNRIGGRDFGPSEYTPKTSAKLIGPGDRVDTTLDILDPGGNAEGFEIDVCLRDSERKIHCANDGAAHAKSTP